MGNCLAFQISCDDSLRKICGCLSGVGNYVKRLTQNLDALEIALDELMARREDLLTLVRKEESKGLQRLAQVQLWLSRVDAIVNKARGLISSRNAETGRLCMNGYCSKNCLSSYAYGEKVLEMLKDVKELKSHEGFDVVAEMILESVDGRPTGPTVGLGRKLDEAWNFLKRDEVGIMGIYGMGGVGKTTLLTQLNNKFAKNLNGFDIVIWITVSRDAPTTRIQDDIGKRLGLHDKRWAQTNEEAKASDIHKILKRKKFVLFLDDVWTESDLQKIGIPYPVQENKCKIAFTSRSKKVSGAKMRTDIEMEVTCLESNDAWDLFQKQVGEITLNIHQDIPKLARDMAERCQGLPLALTVIGGAMVSKRTVHEWRHAMSYFTSPQSQFPDVTDQILPILRFSYDDLKDETVKLCFQYCALFSENYEIEKEALIDYWIAEGLIEDRIRTFAVDFGYMIIGELVRSCLLMNDDSKGIVKMHDMVRELALRIACMSPYNASNFIVKTATSLYAIPHDSTKLMEVGRMSLMGNQIQKAFCDLNCPKLLTLFLHNNDLLELSASLFSSMPKLVVLDLSRNYNLEWLPDISNLVSLRYLDLSHTEIKLLPSGLEMLKSLIYLNLEFTVYLQNIDKLSCLRKLQVLKLLGSSCIFSLFFVGMLPNLESLQVLTLTIDYYPLWTMIQTTWCIQVLSLSKLPLQAITIQAGLWYSLRNIEIRDCKSSSIDINIEDHGNSSDSSNGIFPNLSRVEIINCGMITHLTWLLFAPNLTELRVVRSSQIEEIICEGMTPDEQREVIPFQKLQLLQLQNLDKLKTVYWSPLPFPCLTKVVIFGCPSLRKLPLNSESAKGQNLIIDAEKEWIDNGRMKLLSKGCSKETIPEKKIPRDATFHSSFEFE